MCHFIVNILGKMLAGLIERLERTKWKDIQTNEREDLTLSPIIYRFLHDPGIVLDIYIYMICLNII